MANTGQTSDDKVFVGRVVEAAIRLGLLVLLATFCFLIIEVFIAPALWGIVIAVGIYPFYHKVGEGHIQGKAMGSRRVCRPGDGATTQLISSLIEPGGLKLSKPRPRAALSLIRIDTFSLTMN